MTDYTYTAWLIFASCIASGVSGRCTSEITFFIKRARIRDEERLGKKFQKLIQLYPNLMGLGRGSLIFQNGLRSSLITGRVFFLSLVERDSFCRTLPVKYWSNFCRAEGQGLIFPCRRALAKRDRVRETQEPKYKNFPIGIPYLAPKISFATTVSKAHDTHTMLFQMRNGHHWQ